MKVTNGYQWWVPFFWSGGCLGRYTTSSPYAFRRLLPGTWVEFLRNLFSNEDSFEWQMLRTPRTDDGKKLLKQTVLEAKFHGSQELQQFSGFDFGPLDLIELIYFKNQVVLGTPNFNTCDVDLAACRGRPLPRDWGATQPCATGVWMGCGIDAGQALLTFGGLTHLWKKARSFWWWGPYLTMLEEW